MLELFLLRHGKAHTPEPGMRDHDRPLADRGRMESQRQGEAFPARPGDAALISDALRTRQTWASLQVSWDFTPPHHITSSGYLAEADTWLDLIGMTTPDTQRLWVVGHNPGISELALRLTGDYVGMSTADLVHIALDAEDWASVSWNVGRLLGHHPGRNA